MTWLEIIGLISSIITLICFPIAVLGLYISPPARWELPFRDSYQNIYGNYKMFNFSRERFPDAEGNPRIVEWNVCISKRWLRLPKFVAIYKDSVERWNASYSGKVFVLGSRLIVEMSALERQDDHDDLSYIVFKRPRDNRIDIEIGFLCGYRDPIAPYCGVHILSKQDTITSKEAKEILGNSSSLWFEDFDRRISTVLERKKTLKD